MNIKYAYMSINHETLHSVRSPLSQWSSEQIQLHLATSHDAASRSTNNHKWLSQRDSLGSVDKTLDSQQ